MPLRLTGTGGISLLGGLSVAGLAGYYPDGFVKAAKNPLLPKGTAGAWDAWGVRDFSVLVDEAGVPAPTAGVLRGYYTGIASATGPIGQGFASSADGGLSWVRYSGNPVIAASGVGGSWYQAGVGQGGALRRLDGTYALLATGYASGTVGSAIGLFTSTDGIAWSNGGAKLVLAQLADGVTAVTEMGVPCLLRQASGGYLVLFEALVSGISSGWRIFGATVTDPSSTWTPLNGGQPLLRPTGGGWEQTGVANPHLVEASAGRYLLAYNGRGVDNRWRVGFATSTDLLTWTRWGGNPVLQPGAAGAWDESMAEASALIKGSSTGALRLYYQGYALDGSMQVGLTIAPQPRLALGGG